MRVLIACEFSGRVRDAFLRLGHDAWSCDIIPSDADNSRHIVGDVRKILKDGWDLMIGHPPCTYLTVTANRWFKPEVLEKEPNRIQLREDAVQFFLELYNSPIPRIALENPKGIISTRFRPPDQYVHPFMFGDPVRKMTGLWLKNLGKLVPTNPVDPEFKRYGPQGYRYETKISNTTKSKRAKLRSITPLGLAEAMADQWSKNHVP